MSQRLAHNNQEAGVSCDDSNSLASGYIMCIVFPQMLGVSGKKSNAKSEQYWELLRRQRGLILLRLWSASSLNTLAKPS